MKIKIIVVLMTVLMVASVAMLAGCVDNSTTDPSVFVPTPEPTPAEVPMITVVSYEYPAIFCDDTATDLQKEIYFETNLKNEYVTWTGEVSTISSDGDEFNLHVVHTGLFSDVLVNVRSDQREKVINLREGDSVTYTAKITRWGSFLGFSTVDGTIGSRVDRYTLDEM